MKILIVRNDKLGDFVLSYPVYYFLKSTLPNCEIHVLVPEYTQSIAKSYPWIDQVIIDPGSKAPLSQQIKLLKALRKQQFNAVITLFSTTRIAIISLLAGIKYRLAPATKIAQFFYNHNLTQRRSRSLKPEYEYNLDLAKQFLSDHGFTSLKSATLPGSNNKPVFSCSMISGTPPQFEPITATPARIASGKTKPNVSHLVAKTTASKQGIILVGLL